MNLCYTKLIVIACKHDVSQPIGIKNIRTSKTWNIKNQKTDLITHFIRRVHSYLKLI